MNAWPARSARAIRSIASGNCSSNFRIRCVALHAHDAMNGSMAAKQRRRERRASGMPVSVQHDHHGHHARTRSDDQQERADRHAPCPTASISSSSGPDAVRPAAAGPRRSAGTSLSCCACFSSARRVLLRGALRPSAGARRRRCVLLLGPDDEQPVGADDDQAADDEGDAERMPSESPLAPPALTSCTCSNMSIGSVHAGGGEPLGALRPDAGGAERARRPCRSRSMPGLLEHEDVLHRDDVAVPCR